MFVIDLSGNDATMMIFRHVLERLISRFEADINEMFCFPPVDLFRRCEKMQTKWKEDLFSLKHKTTPLIYALSLQKYTLMDQMLYYGASTSRADQDGVTPMMYAARLVSDI